MGLKNYKPERHEFVLKGGSFHVRGLALEDVSRLVNHHLPDLEALFDLFTQTRVSELEDRQFERLVMSIVQQAPGFAANVIALACDEPDSANEAASLPFPVQVQVLTKIGDLTFYDVGGLGKGMESIAALLKKTNLEASLKRVSAKAG